MTEEIKAMLKRHRYNFILNFDKDGTITLDIPARVQQPPLESTQLRYKISKDLVSFSSKHKGKLSEILDFECPQYAARTLVSVQITKICQKLGFDTEFLEYRNGKDIITREGFFHQMWPQGVKKTELMTEQEHNLRVVVLKAITCPIPFHPDFGLEAQQAGVEFGYEIIRQLYLGE